MARKNGKNRLKWRENQASTGRSGGNVISVRAAEKPVGRAMRRHKRAHQNPTAPAITSPQIGNMKRTPAIPRQLKLRITREFAVPMRPGFSAIRINGKAV